MLHTLHIEIQGQGHALSASSCVKNRKQLSRIYKDLMFSYLHHFIPKFKKKLRTFRISLCNAVAQLLQIFIVFATLLTFQEKVPPIVLIRLYASFYYSISHTTLCYCKAKMCFFAAGSNNVLALSSRPGSRR